MQGIAQKIMMAPERYSVDMLRRAIETGLLPAYIGVPLIQAKMQSRQQMQQSAALGQPSPDQQPTVAQQVMGQSGVEALPSNLPQEYAAGGIVAFDRGGEVERFQNQGLVRDIREEERRQTMSMLRTDPTRGIDTSGLSPVGIIKRGASSPSTMSMLRTDPTRGIDTSGLSQIEARKEETPRPASLFGLLPGLPLPKNLSQGINYVPPARNIPVTPTPTPAAAAQQRPPAPRPQGLSGAPRPPAPEQGIAALPATEKPPELVRPVGPTATESARELFGKAREEAEGISRDTEARIREARGLMQGEAFEDYKKQLEAEARRSGADRADAKNMALFKAGLAMMAGTSRHALENIGKGALTGVEDFQTAARELRKADKDRQKEFALIEQARRAEKAGNVKEEVQLLQRAEDRRLSALGNMTTAISAATGVDRSESMNIALQNYTQRSQNYRLGQQLTSQEREGDADRANRLQVAGIGAEATVRAALARVPEGMSASERNRLAKDVRDLLPEAESAVVKQLNLKTPPPIPQPDLPPTHPSVIAYNDFQAAVNNYVNSKLARVQSFIPQGRAAPQTPAPAVPDPFVGYERLR
jgi:hypothetical protein